MCIRDRPEFRAGYLTVFDPAHILQLYEEGITSTQYDFMINNGNDNNYYWMRITVKIFYWDDDQSIRMFVYRQNIDEEKRKELFMNCLLYTSHTVFIIPRRARSKRAKNVIRIRYRASQFIGLLRCFFCVF